MPRPLVLILTPSQLKELEWARDKHALPYVRERAAASLKIAAGQSGRDVALHRLLKSHAPDTVYGWVKRYKDEGFKGLLIRPGRGRKPAFSPLSTQTLTVPVKRCCTSCAATRISLGRTGLAGP